MVDTPGGALPGATVELVNEDTDVTAANFLEVTGTSNPRAIQVQVRLGF